MSRIPVMAIGGIGPENAGDVIDAGAAPIGVQRAPDITVRRWMAQRGGGISPAADPQDLPSLIEGRKRAGDQHDRNRQS